MAKKKEQIKIYIRTFYFSDGSVESVEGDSKKIMTFTGKWARAKFGKIAINEIKDTVRFEHVEG